MLETYQGDAIENRVSELQEKGAIISNLLVSSNYFSGVSTMDTTDTEEEINPCGTRGCPSWQGYVQPPSAPTHGAYPWCSSA